MHPTEFDRARIRALLAEGEHTLAAVPHPERARRDAETLFLHVLKKTDPERNLAWLIAHEDEAVATETARRFRALVGRRAAGEPIQYITGEAEFYGLAFHVNRDVLIPRPETEHLVERAIGLARAFGRPRIVDVGTGSGAIAVALAKVLPEARICATEISSAALEVARGNAERHGVASRVRFFEGDLLEPVASERFDIVVSNPPYVAENDRDSLTVEVRDNEPRAALFAGADGFDVHRRLIPAAFEALVRGGFVALEIGYGQRDAVEALLTGAGFGGVEFTADLQGIPRVATGRRP
ncbi:MAG: peptide chain release factor N(5)-glutamine methyltransferase [Terracidiphilus sp.]